MPQAGSWRRGAPFAGGGGDQTPCVARRCRKDPRVATPAPRSPSPAPEADSRAAGSQRALALALAASLVLFGAAVKLYTGHVWEDFLITFRFSENLVLGNGLVYQPGERVCG